MRVPVLALLLSWPLESDSRLWPSRETTCAFCLPQNVQRNQRYGRSALSSANKRAKDKGKQEEKDDSEDGFSTWVQGISSRWPLYPPSPKEEEALVGSTTQNRKDSPRSGFIPIPLANLINVEALLMLNGEETMESKTTELADLYATTTRGAGEDESSTTWTVNNATLQSFAKNETTPTTTNGTSIAPLSILPYLEEIANWEQLVENIRKSVAGAANTSSTAATSIIGGTTDALLRQATSRIEYLVGEASTVISPLAVQDLFQRAGRALSTQQRQQAPVDFVKVATTLAREQGLDVREAAERARQTTEYTTNLVKLANGVLQNGYAPPNIGQSKKLVTNETTQEVSLFAEFPSAKMLQSPSTVQKAAELGSLCGAIYEETIPRTLGLGHSIVANGTTEDVNWMVTDCVANENEYQESDNDQSTAEPILVRTIIIRGYDASDDSVDREDLLNRICTATPEPLSNGVLVHGGLMEIARAIYDDIVQYIDLTPPDHRIVLTGHSVGGSISLLLLLLLVEDRGVDFVRDKVLRVYTFGSPPVTCIPRGFYDGEVEEHLRSIGGVREVNPERELYKCDVLKAFGLPCSTVYGFVQPWDPIVRLFTEIDPLYPLVSDMGDDGVTPYASGPPRTLRPITRAIFEAWEGWPLFRDTFRSTVSQNYTSAGVQHILLPEPIRYLTDRFVAANVNVPPVESMVRISSKELLPGLDKTFPLDAFRISFVPAAIRGFIHHFYPAYGFPIVDYATKKLKRQPVSKKINDREKEDYRKTLDKVEGTLLAEINRAEKMKPSRQKEKSQTAEAGRWSTRGWLPNAKRGKEPEP